MFTNNYARYQRRLSAGFTIVELLMVVVIIGLLATITVVSYSGIQQRARESKITADLSTADRKIKTYSIEYSALPSTETQVQNYQFGGVVQNGVVCVYGSCDPGSLTIPRGTYLVSVYNDGTNAQVNVYYWDYTAGLWRERWWAQGASTSGELVGPVDEDYGTCTEQDFINCPPKSVALD